MLNLDLKNCYGIKKFETNKIVFNNNNNIAFIYASNGVMKTSFTKLFDDISKGEATKDQLYPQNKTTYKINFFNEQYSNDDLKLHDNIYALKSFDDTYFPETESVALVLDDDNVRKEYADITNSANALTKELFDNLSLLSGVKANEIEEKIKLDFNLPSETTNLANIFEKVKSESEKRMKINNYNLKYSDLYNVKTEKIYKDKQVIEQIEEYCNYLNKVFNESDINFLSQSFTDYNANELSKSFASNNLFDDGRKIVLKDESNITTLEQWDKKIQEQMDSINDSKDTKKLIQFLNKKLNGNLETRKLKEILLKNTLLLKQIFNGDEFKKELWLSYFKNLDKGFQVYYKDINKYSDRLNEIYKKANEQSRRWNEIVTDFNNRYKLPYEAIITNKANILLKKAPPIIKFKYKGIDDEGNEIENDFSKDDLKDTLSRGEKNAMYFFYNLFKINELITKAKKNKEKKFLLILDDIADSFDYKNKYAIIEYLFDISRIENINLLILTHNFDFYRTASNRLQKNYENMFLAEKDERNVIKLKEFKYKKDYFNNAILKNLQDDCSKGMSEYEHKIELIASIPFFRNINEYLQENDKSIELINFLHIKEKTKNLKLSDIRNFLPGNLKDKIHIKNNENYLTVLVECAEYLIQQSEEQIKLENKIVLSIAIRLKFEEFLLEIAENNDIKTNDIKSNQTRNLYEKVKEKLNGQQNKIAEDVNIITPEYIHINSFMFEPLIDISDWKLKQLYKNVKNIKNI